MFGKIESLRGVAACLVILFHSPFNYGMQPLTFITNSYLFVDFFFILSGFVMSFAYKRKIGNGLTFQYYILLRLARVYPLHIFMLIAWIPYVLVKQYLYTSGIGGSDPSETANIYSFISNFLLIHSMGLHNYLSWNNPSWSISSEFFAYIIFFIATRTIDRKNYLFTPLVISIACYAMLFNLDYKNFDFTYDYGFLRCIASFYLGVFIYRLRKLEIKINLIPILEVLSVTSLIVAVIYSDLGNVAIIITMISFSATILVFTSSENGYLGKILESHIMRSIGLWSYSIYMIHALIVAGISNFFEYVLEIDLNNSLGLMAILINGSLVLLTILISKYSYLYIEKRFRDLAKQKIMNKYKS